MDVKLKSVRHTLPAILHEARVLEMKSNLLECDSVGREVFINYSTRPKIEALKSLNDRKHSAS